MKILKYHNIILLLCLIVMITTFSSVTYIGSQHERFQPAFIEDIQVNRGNSIDASTKVSQNPKQYFNELDIDVLQQMLISIVPNHIYKKGTLQSTAQLTTDSPIFKQVKLKESVFISDIGGILTQGLNNQLEKFDKYTSTIKFKALEGKIIRVIKNDKDTYLISIVITFHRETKRHGIVLEIDWLINNNMMLISNGIQSVKIIGVLSEDQLELNSGFEHEQTLRSYGTNIQFIKDETVVQSVDFESNMLKKQSDDMMDERGISSLSFFHK